MSPRRNVLSVFLAAGLSLGLAAASLAQSSDAPLKGPQVQDRKVPGVEGKFGEGGNEKNKLQSEQRIPPRVYKDALGTLKGDQAPADVRLSAEQEMKLKSIVDEFESSSKAFMQANRAKIAELRKARENGEDGGGGKGDSSRAAYRDLMQQAPKIEDAWTKVWAELSPAQQNAVNAKLDEFRARASEMRQNEYVQKRLNRKLDKPGNGGPGNGGPEGDRPRPPQPPGPGADRRGPGGPGGPEGPRGGPRIDPERHERLMRLLSRMSPEQQDELIRRLEERVGRGPDQPGPGPEGERRARRRPGRGPGEDRPAPPVPPVPPMPPMPSEGPGDPMQDDPMTPPPPPPAPPAPGE